MTIRRGFARARTAAVAAVTAALAMTALCGPAAAASPDPSPWLQTGYNAASSNANLAETSLGAADLHTLQPRLSVTAQRSTSFGCSSAPEAPALAQSRLYTVVDGVLEAFDVNSGQRLWSTPIQPDDSSMFVHIAVSHGLVIIAYEDCYTQDPVTSLDAYDSDTGAPVWNTFYDEALHGFSVSGKYLVAQTGCFYCDQSTYVYQVQSGALVWSRTASIGNQGPVFEPGIVVDHRAFSDELAPGVGWSLRALRVGTGQVAWSLPGRWTAVAGDTDAATARTLLVRNVFSGVTWVLDPATGARRFTLPGFDSTTGDVAVTGSQVIGFCGSSQQQVCAFDAGTGALQWRVANPGARVDYALVYANGLVYLPGGTVLDAATGSKVATVPGSPVLVGSGRVVTYHRASVRVYQPR